MTQELVRIESTPSFSAEELETAQRYARLFEASGLFADTRDMAQAAVKIIAGRELGLSPMQAMQMIHIIKGKVCLGAHAMASIIATRGFKYRVVYHTDEACAIQFLNAGGEVLGTSRFTIKDANAAGLTRSGGGWSKHPKNMLYARAMSNGAKWFCAAAFGGNSVYTPDELSGPIEPLDVVPLEARLSEVESMEFEEKGANGFELGSEAEGLELPPTQDKTTSESTSTNKRKVHGIEAFNEY